MDKAENNEQIDADILECKTDILRARDIIPGGQQPYKQKAQQEPSSQISGKQKTSEAGTETPLKDNKQEKTEIPRFDLAENIMAEHRRVISIRRKAPDKKIEVQEPKSQPISYNNIKPHSQELSEEERIIAEIVARDIEMLHQGSNLCVQ